MLGEPVVIAELAPARFHLHAVERGERRLAETHRDDRDVYTNAKAPFIRGALGKSMSYQLTLVEKPSYLHATASGDHTPQNAARFLREAHEACVQREKQALLLEMNFSGPSLDPSGIFGVVGEAASRPGAKLRKIAYVDTSARDPEKMKFAETIALNRGVNVRLFRDVEEAKRWMAEGDADRR